MSDGGPGKVLVAMSGGVDSSVAAALLQEAGHEVVGCFMRLGSDRADESAAGFDNVDETCDPDGAQTRHQGCCSVNDAHDARLVAANLGIPFYVLNFKRDFGRIIDYFVDEYNAGRTPNPCIRCNDWLKFGKLLGYADTIGADWVATGHYARIDRTGECPRLLRGRDREKDQSYVLFGTRPDRLERMLLPLGAYRKSEIRAIAERLGLEVSGKPDSQEICFVPGKDYTRLLERRTPETLEEGPILDEDGREVGRHGGQQRFTIGQRRGLGVALGYPVYVVDKDPATNAVRVGSREKLLADGLVAAELNFLEEPPRAAPRPCAVKIRYNGPLVPATMRLTGEDELTVTFEHPQSAVTPGQAVCCYDGETVIGGGWVRSAIPSAEAAPAETA